jgi:PAS domain S-box-containing protein
MDGSRVTAERLATVVAVLAGAATAGIGALELAGGITGKPLLPAYPPGAPTLGPWVAVALIVLGLGMPGALAAAHHRLVRRATVAGALLVLAASALAFAIKVGGWPLHLGPLGSLVRLPGSLVLAVLSAHTLVAPTLACASIGLLCLASKRARPVAGGFALAVLLVGFVVCLGYLYGGPLFHSQPWRAVPLAAGIAALLVGTGLVAVGGPAVWPLRVMAGDTVRALMLRRFLPLVVLAVLIADAAAGALFSKLSHAQGSVLTSVASIAAAVIVVYFLARIVGGRLDRAEQETRRLRRLSAVLSQTNALIVRVDSPQTLFDEACRIAVASGGFEMAWVGAVDPETHLVTVVAAYGNEGSYLDGIRISVDDVPEGRGPTGRALREGQASICRNIARDPRMAPWRTRALAAGFEASAAFPLRTLDTVTHAYTIYAREVGWFSDEQVGLLTELASDMSFALGVLAGERQRREAEEQLVASENRFRSLIENSSDLVTITDAAGKILYVSPSVKRLLGFEPQERLGGWILDNVHPEDADRLREVLDTLAPGGKSSAITYRLFDRFGGWRVVESVGWNMLGIPGVAGIVIHSRDVTERQTLEGALRQAQKMEAVGQLASGIAHDFNNLLSVIMANTDLISATLPAHLANGREEMQDVQNAAQRGKAMVRQLMSLSRVGELELRPTDLGVLAGRVAKMLRRILPSSVRVEAAVESGLPAVLADRGSVEQILLNLATNARDAMPEGGQLRVAVGCDGGVEQEDGGTGDRVTVAVTDTGTGMDDETLRHVFDPFFTTKPPGVGTGLGMAMVYGLMKQHGGSVEVSSRPGEGTTVRLSFPVTAAAAAEAPEPEESHEHVAHRGTETVLVVEDDDALRRTAQRILQRHGYRVLVAEDGEVALKALRERGASVDLVFTDLTMPKMGGAALYREAGRASQGLRFLIASGYSASDAPDSRGLPTGLPFIKKPWTLVELLEGVRRALDGPAPERPPA